MLRLYDDIFDIYGFAGICLSEEGDLLSQWCAYFENGAGVSIGFNSAAFYKEPEPLTAPPTPRTPPPPPPLPPLFRVIYDENIQRRIIAPNVEHIFKFFEGNPTINTDKFFEYFENMPS